MGVEFGSHLTSFPGSGYEWAGISTAPYQVAEYFSGFPGGQITDIYCYVASHHGMGNTNMNLCIWDGAGNLLIQSGTISVGPGSGGNSGQSYQHANVGAIYIGAGGYYIGWWRAPSGSFETSWATGGSYVHSSANPAGALSTGYSSQSGTIGVYLVYNPGAAYVRRSGSWAVTQPAVRRSGTWSNGIPYVRRSGIWVPGA